jgi:hypothetical protein
MDALWSSTVHVDVVNASSYEQPHLDVPNFRREAYKMLQHGSARTFARTSHGD